MQKLYRFEIFTAAILIGYPFAGFAGIIEIQHRGDAIDANAVGVIFFEPENRAGDKETPHLAAAVVEDIAFPVGVIALPRVGMLEKVRAVKIAKAVLVGGKMRWHPVENNADAELVQAVDEVHKFLRIAVAAGRGKIAKTSDIPMTDNKDVPSPA